MTMNKKPNDPDIWNKTPEPMCIEEETTIDFSGFLFQISGSLGFLFIVIVTPFDL